MGTIRVTIPSMLATLVKGDRRFTVEAGDVRGVLDGIFARHPELRVHLLDESGAMRQHVTVFHNDAVVRGFATLVSHDDEVTILQAVSGGTSQS